MRWGHPVRSYRGHAIAVGVLLLACALTSVLSGPLGSTLESSDYMQRMAVADNRVVVTALLEFLWAATGAGIAIGLYPVVRGHNRALALGAVAGRVVEGVFVMIGSLRGFTAPGAVIDYASPGTTTPVAV